MAHSRALETVPEEEDGLTHSIEFHLKNIYVSEGMNATFELKVLGSVPDVTWYKNGRVLQRNPRYEVTVRGHWHRLTIILAQRVDTGIYTLICRNDSGYSVSQAMLVVIFERPSPLLTKPQKAIYLSWPKTKLQVTSHLKNLRIKQGDRIKLRVEISEDSRALKPEFLWYVGNRSFTTFNDACQITACDHSFSEFVKYNAEVNDSGFYTVLVVCKDMVISSSAEVVVMDPEYLPPCQIENSGFLYYLPDELEVCENEEVSLACKADIDVNTSVTWQKNGKCLKADKNIVFESVEGRGVGIQIVQASKEDSGIYTAVVRNDKTGSECSSQCVLIVNPAPKVMPIEIQHPLKVVLTSIGSRVGFYCKFQVPTPKTFYAVWRIGLFKVERSTSQFKVLSNQLGMNVLVIKNVDPDMLGEVSCQLRYFLPSRRSVQVAITKGLLVHVPSEAIADESIGEYEICIEKIYANFTLEKTVVLYTAAERWANSEWSSPDDEARRQDEAASYPHEVSAERWDTRADTSSLQFFDTTFSDDDTRVSGTLSPITEISPEVSPTKLYPCALLQNVEEDDLMELVYSRLELEYCHFMMVQTSRRRRVMITALTLGDEIDETSAGGTRAQQSRFELIKIQWNKDGELPPGTLYAIDSAQPSGDYCRAGVTSKPQITIRSPRGGDASLMLFRIAIIHTTAKHEEVTIELCPPMPNNVKKTTVNNMPFEEFGKSFSQIGEAMGNGAYGAVYLVKSRAGQLYAAKVVKTRTEKRRESTRREIDIMKLLHHHRIVQLYFTFHSRDQCILVMEYLWGGELFERIIEEDNFKERTAVHYVHQICEGLEYLHRQTIVHLDIKPENVVCVSRNSRNIKIVDFGLSRVLQKSMVRAIYGTRDYIAPEVLSFEAIKPSSDMWSLGVVTYVMLSGMIPFVGTSWPERAANITKGAYNFDDPAFDTVTAEAKDFVNSLLLLDPDERLTAVTARQHPWMVSRPAHEVGIGQTKRWRTNLKTYLETNKARWQRAGNVVIAANRLLIGAHREGTPRLSVT